MRQEPPLVECNVDSLYQKAKVLVSRLSVSLLATLGSVTCVPALAQQPSLGEQLAAAVLPLPTSLREGAGVLRWIGPARTEQLRESRNGMSCTVDDPTDDQLDVRCYHDAFWVVIRRARELRQRLPSQEAVNEQLRRESMDGEIRLPPAPTAGYRMLGPISAYDRKTHQVGPEIRKWQSIHFPFHTAEEMGLPEARELNEPASPGLMPFVMSSGTWWSHVMIVHEPLR